MSDLSNKYIREYHWGLLVDIRRAGEVYQRRFPFRMHADRNAAWTAARQWRDATHKAAFGTMVTEGFRHVRKRIDAKNPELPPGISLGHAARKPTKNHPSGKVPTYFVVNYMTRDPLTGRKKPARQRYNFRKLGQEEALRRAMSFHAALPGDL